MANPVPSKELVVMFERNLRARRDMTYPLTPSDEVIKQLAFDAATTYRIATDAYEGIGNGGPGGVSQAYVDAAMAAEIVARTAAIAASVVNFITGSAAQSMVDATVGAAIGTEVSARNTTIAAAISAEVVARNNAISAAIGTGYVTSTTLTNAINTEVTNRDAAIAQAIAGVVTIDAINAAIATEVTNRNAAIASALAGTATSGAIATAVANEAGLRAAADLVLGNNLTNEINARTAGDAAEVTARTAALTAQFNVLTTNYGNAIQAAVGAEATARANAVTAEATARTAADTAEVTNRNNAITAAINTEIAARNAAIAEAISSSGSGVNAAYVANAIETERTARTVAINAESAYRTSEDARIAAIAQNALDAVRNSPNAVNLATLGDYADDAAAAAAGVPENGMYRSGSHLMVRAPSSGPVTRSLGLNPTDMNGQSLGNKTFVVTTTGIASLTYVMRNPDYSWLGQTVTIPTTGEVTIAVLFNQQDQSFRIWPTGDYDFGKETTQIKVPVTGGSGGTGGTGTPDPFPVGPKNGTPGNFSLILKGQSNAVFFGDSYTQSFKSIWKMMDNLRVYTGLSSVELVEHYARNDQASDFSLASGSYNFHFDQGGDPKWMDPYGHDFNNPATWANTDIMDGFIRYLTTQKSSVAMNRPVGIIWMHSEYDSRLGELGRTNYKAGITEEIKRARAALGRPVNLSPIFFMAPCYDSGTNDDTMKTIRDVYRELCLDTTMGCFLWSGSTLDAVDRSDASHWDDASSDRAAFRGAVIAARWMSDNGWARNDCSSFPRLGPTVVSIETVAGNTSALDLIWGHQGGADNVAIGSSMDWDNHYVFDNGTRRYVTGASSVSGTRTRLSLSSPLTSTNVVYDFGRRTPFGGPDSQFTDNWHTKPKPSFTSGSDINLTRMIQNRYNAPVVLGAVIAPPDSGGIGSGAGAPAGWVKTFEDTFSQPPALGVNALDNGKWKRRGFGYGAAHGGAPDYLNRYVLWDGGQGLESTGTTLKVRTRVVDGQWRCSGFMQGSSDVPGNWAYHPGYGEFYVKYRARMSHLNAPGIGSYTLMWPNDDGWSSEIDIMESPGTTKNNPMATMHWDSRGLYDLGGSNDQTDAFPNSPVDMTEYHIWECYRTYRTVGGKLKATIRVKIDGVDVGDPGDWTDNEFLCERMVFGAAGFVGTGGNESWYSPVTSATPTDFWMEMDYVEIWEPPSGSGGGTIPTDPTTPTPHTIVEPLPVAQLGAHVYTINTLNIPNGTKMTMNVFNGPDAWSATGILVTGTVSANQCTFPSVTLASNQFYKVWEGDGYGSPTISNQKDSNLV